MSFSIYSLAITEKRTKPPWYMLQAFHLCSTQLPIHLWLIYSNSGLSHGQYHCFVANLHSWSIMFRSGRQLRFFFWSKSLKCFIFLCITWVIENLCDFTDHSETLNIEAIDFLQIRTKFSFSLFFSIILKGWNSWIRGSLDIYTSADLTRFNYIIHIKLYFLTCWFKWVLISSQPNQEGNDIKPWNTYTIPHIYAKLQHILHILFQYSLTLKTFNKNLQKRPFSWLGFFRTFFWNIVFFISTFLNMIFHCFYIK